MAWPLDLWMTVVSTSAAFACAMLGELGVLLRRRHRIERGAAAAEQVTRAVTRDLLTAISAGPGEARFDAFDAASATERLRATRHLIQLLRGHDRERLFEIAERAGLFDPMLALLRSRAAVRRVEAVRDLEQLASEQCVEALLGCLANDPAMPVRLEAAAALARIGRLPDLRSLLGMLDFEAGPLTKLHAALFRSVAARDADALVGLTFDADFAGQRAMLVDALGWTEGFAVLDALERHGDDADPEVRCAALRAGRRIGHPAAGRWIAPLLGDGCEQVRVQAVQSCGALGLVETVPAIAALADDPSWWVRTRAAEALEQLTPASADASARALVAA